jgi:EAL domain-containing protein (putative c-di-GMP-specific phosphodiesterase class I)
LIESKNFSLNYQPVVSLADRDLHHYEALMRFTDGRKPYETIRLSEQLGLVPAFDLAVCQKALDALIQHPHAHIAVNISGMSMESATFREDLRKLLMPFSGIQDRLMFELTESSEIKDMETASSYLRWLRKMGYRVCLDDFGAGAAAYSYLRYFEVDFVKIDGVFIKEACEDVRQRALLRSIAGLCKELKSEVIAEMIEDEATAKMCASLGIGLGQGFLFGKPKPQIDAPKDMVGRRQGFKESWA